MCRTFTYADRPNNIKNTSSLHEALCPEVFWPFLSFHPPSKEKKRKNNHFFCPNFKWIPNFSNNVETSGLWPHLDSKYFLTDFFLTSRCYISLLLSLHRSQYSCELSFELSKILNYCASSISPVRDHVNITQPNVFSCQTCTNDVKKIKR